MNTDEVLCKLIERNKIYTEVNNLNNILETKNKSIEEIDLWLKKNCNHVWEYYRESSHDTPDYKCKKCNLFKS